MNRKAKKLAAAFGRRYKCQWCGRVHDGMNWVENSGCPEPDLKGRCDCAVYEDVGRTMQWWETKRTRCTGGRVCYGMPF
jgi:hypothetical protein